MVGAIAMACVGLVLAEPLIRLGTCDGIGSHGDLGDAWVDVLPSLFLDGLLRALIPARTTRARSPRYISGEEARAVGA